MERYTRNFNSLSYEDQIILNNSKIAIVGLGGLGGYILENLLRIGIRNFHLIDKDIFEITNLNRQLLSTQDNLGKNKVDIALERAKSIDHKVNIKIFKEKLNENSFSLLNGVQLVMDGLDSIEGKLDLESLCDKMDLPLIHGAIGGYYGQIAYSHKNNRTVKKIYGTSKDSPNQLGNLSIACMITASLQCSLALKVLLNHPIDDKLIFIDTKEMIIEKIEF